MTSPPAARASWTRSPRATGFASRASTRMHSSSAWQRVAGSGGVRQDRRRRRRLHPEPGEHSDHRPRRRQARHSEGENRRQRRTLRQHLLGLDSTRARGCAGRGAPSGRSARADDRDGCGPHVGLWFDRMDGEREDSMTGSNTKIAFCFPGQGSLEAGMGREIAEAFPEAMEVFRVGSEASGLDLRHLCFEGHEKELVDTAVQQPALVATSLAVLAALKARGIEPDYVVGHSVGEFAALAAANALSTEEALVLVRERGLAMAEAARERPGSMAAILGLDDPVVERLCRQIIGVWPANYNCPGQVVVSGENPAVDEC